MTFGSPFMRRKNADYLAQQRDQRAPRVCDECPACEAMAGGAGLCDDHEIATLQADVASLRAERDLLVMLVFDLYEWMPGFNPSGLDEDDRQLRLLTERAHELTGFAFPPTTEETL